MFNKLILIILFCAGMLFGQTRYYSPVPIENPGGTPIRNATVIAYPTGTTSNGTTLTYSHGSQYYTESLPDNQAYDFYVNGIIHLTGIFWGRPPADSYSQAYVDSGMVKYYATTAAMSAETGTNIKQFYVDETYVGGYFTRRSAAFCQAVFGDSTARGAIIFSSTVAGQRIVRNFERKEINATWAGVLPDSTGNNVTAMALAITVGQALGINTIYMPEGHYLFSKAVGVSGGLIELKAGMTLKGAGQDKTIIWNTIDTSSIVIWNNELEATIAAIPLRDRNHTVQDLTINGNYPNDGTTGSQVFAGEGAGILFKGYEAAILNNTIVKDVTIRGIRKEMVKTENAVYASYRNIICEDNNMTAFTPIAIHSEIIDCIVDTAHSTLETVARTFSEHPETEPSLVIRNLRAKNLYYTGGRIYGGGRTTVENSTFEGISTLSTMAAGLFFGARDEYPYSFTELIVKDSKLTGFSDGLKFKVTSTNTLGDVIVDNVTIDNVNDPGIEVYVPDTSFVSSLVIRNSRITNYNQSNGSITVNPGIYINGVEKPYIHHNKVYTDVINDGPVYILNSDSARFEYNDFRNWVSGDRLNIITTSENSTFPTAMYNQGLDSSKAIKRVGTPTTYEYQKFWIGLNGYSYAKDARLGVDIHGEYAFRDSSETIALTAGDWALITNEDSTLWGATSKISNATTQGDSVIFNQAGIIALVGGTIQLKQVGTDSIEIQIGGYLDGVLQQSSRRTYTLQDAAWHTLPFPAWSFDVSANTAFYWKIRNVGSNNDIIVNSAWYIFNDL